MDQIQDFKSLQDEIQKALVATTRISGQIASEDLGFHRSLDPEVGAALDEQSARLLALSNALLKSAASLSELTAPVLEDVDDVENNWRNVVDVVDSLLEKADTSLDEYTGVIKRRVTTSAPNAESSKSRNPKPTSSLGNAFRTRNMLKPQNAFELKQDNYDTSPWKPILTTKPHAIQPLEESLGTFTNDYDQMQYDYSIFLSLLPEKPLPTKPEGLSKSQRGNYNKQVKRYRHPYETEILQLAYPEAVYQTSEPIPYLPVETTSAIFVDTEEGVLEMLEELKTATEIAVDVEHHDARSYIGLVSLMQISTRNKDWIIDTLKPWRHKLQVLNEVFADPKIIKVFHGAYMDIIWLQRDLGLYVVGMFDTHHASRTLRYQGGSLAFLLKKFIDFDADKKYQLADWRIRPIPEEMFFYARADTHFLLYIYDHMRNELTDRTNTDVPDENLIEIVLQKSKETCLLRHERQAYSEETGKGPGGWYQLLAKTPALFNNEQFAVFRAVHSWRDRISRADDDSINYVMANHVVFTIAKLMPMDMAALFAVLHPITSNVKSRTRELLDIIKSAKASGTNGPSMMDVLRPDTLGAVAKTNLPSVAAKSAPATLVAVVDGEELRSQQSSFWGGAFGSSIWDTPAETKSDNDLRLAVPLPALSSEIFAGSGTPNGLTNRSKPQTETAMPIQSYEPATKSSKDADEAFVIKRGAKRKSEAVSEDDGEGGGEEEGGFDISFNDISMSEEERNRLEKKAGKKAKSERKKQKKRAKAAAKAEEMDDDDNEEPFDYSKAESVLHGKKKVGEEKADKNGKKPFDPYAKSADAPKGMRRLQTERPGKSQTFKG